MESSEHSWSDFVSKGVFEQILLSAAGVPITYLLLKGTEAPESWLILNPILSLSCFLAAFLRVWKTAKEEAETAFVWEEISCCLPRGARTIDLLLEGPYLFTVFLMPFFSVSFQFFVVILAAFYLTDFLYNWLFLSSLRGHHTRRSYSDDAREGCPYRVYFVRRQVMTTILVAVTTASSVFAWRFALQGETDEYLWTGFLCVGVVILFEGVLDYHLNLDFHYSGGALPENSIEVVPLSEEDAQNQSLRKQLTTIHNAAFEEEERHISMERMLDEDGRNGNRLRIVKVRGGTAGYVFFEQYDDLQCAVLWYIAIDKRWRRRKVGSRAIREVLSELEYAAKPTRWVLLEVRRSASLNPRESTKQLLNRFYRKQRGHRLWGLDYVLPSNTDSSKDLDYDIIAIPIGSDVQVRQLEDALCRMLDDELPRYEERRARLQGSIENVLVQEPN